MSTVVEVEFALDGPPMVTTKWARLEPRSMATDATETDKGIGIAVVLGALALASAAVPLAAAGTELAAWGFAGAIVFGLLLIAAIHTYW